MGGPDTPQSVRATCSQLNVDIRQLNKYRKYVIRKQFTPSS